MFSLHLVFVITRICRIIMNMNFLSNIVKLTTLHRIVQMKKIKKISQLWYNVTSLRFWLHQNVISSWSLWSADRAIRLTRTGGGGPGGGPGGPGGGGTGSRDMSWSRGNGGGGGPIGTGSGGIGPRGTGGRGGPENGGSRGGGRRSRFSTHGSIGRVTGPGGGRGSLMFIGSKVALLASMRAVMKVLGSFGGAGENTYTVLLGRTMLRGSNGSLVRPKSGAICVSWYWPTLKSVRRE